MKKWSLFPVSFPKFCLLAYRKLDVFWCFLEFSGLHYKEIVIYVDWIDHCLASRSDPLNYEREAFPLFMLLTPFIHLSCTWAQSQGWTIVWPLTSSLPPPPTPWIGKGKGEGETEGECEGERIIVGYCPGIQPISTLLSSTLPLPFCPLPLFPIQIREAQTLAHHRVLAGSTRH